MLRGRQTVTGFRQHVIRLFWAAYYTVVRVGRNDVDWSRYLQRSRRLWRPTATAFVRRDALRRCWEIRLADGDVSAEETTLRCVVLRSREDARIVGLIVEDDVLNKPRVEFPRIYDASA